MRLFFSHSLLFLSPKKKIKSDTPSEMTDSFFFLEKERERGLCSGLLWTKGIFIFEEKETENESLYRKQHIYT